MTTPDDILDKLDNLPDLIKEIPDNMWDNKSDVVLQQEYDEKRKKQIRKLQIEYDYTKSKAEASWDEEYPKGANTWKGRYASLNAYGEQMLIDKVNELTKTVNLLINYLKKI